MRHQFWVAARKKDALNSILFITSNSGTTLERFREIGRGLQKDSNEDKKPRNNVIWTMIERAECV